MNLKAGLVVLVLASTGCGGGDTTSSGGPTEHAGVYQGTITSAGQSRPLRIVITADGLVMLQVIGGAVCPGDLPASIGLDGKAFSSTTTEECLVNGLPCPVNTSISGTVSDGSVSGSGQVLLGCPGTPVQPVPFTFVALEEEE